MSETMLQIAFDIMIYTGVIYTSLFILALIVGYTGIFIDRIMEYYRGRNNENN